MAKEWGQWVNVEQLSKGGQGTTFKVRRTSEPEGEIFVLKRLDNNKRIARFEQEIQILQSLNHPNIIRLVEHGVERNDSFYVAEYCPDGTLENLDVSDLSTVERLELFLAICEAVGTLHQGKTWIVHRDIKPANIFLKKKTPVIGDFGLSHTGTQEARLTATNEAAGPRLYMAPELEDGRSDDVHPAADVYSLGKLLYWLCAGRVFAREKHRDPIWNLAREHPRDPDMYLINDLLDRTVVHAASSRIQFAFDLASAVKEVMQILSHDGHHLNIDSPQICGYCRLGTYSVQLDEWAHSGGGLASDSSIWFAPASFEMADPVLRSLRESADVQAGSRRWRLKMAGTQEPGAFPGQVGEAAKPSRSSNGEEHRPAG